MPEQNSRSIVRVVVVYRDLETARVMRYMYSDADDCTHVQIGCDNF